MAKPGDLVSVDYERIREIMTELGEDLDVLGMTAPLEEITGEGRLGRAVRNPRTKGDLLVIDAYIKELAKELLKEKARHPGEVINKALEALNHACIEFPKCFERFRGEDEASTSLVPAGASGVRVPARVTAATAQKMKAAAMVAARRR